MSYRAPFFIVSCISKTFWTYYYSRRYDAVSGKYKDALINSKAGAIIINEELKEHCNTNAIIVNNVYLAYSILSHRFKQSQDINDLRYGNQVSYPNAQIASSSLIGKNVNIGSHTLIHHNCVIEDNTCLLYTSPSPRD